MASNSSATAAPSAPQAPHAPHPRRHHDSPPVPANPTMLFLLETVRLGLSNLRLHLLRSFLTALGIILGVGAVITMVSIGEGSKQQALEQIERLGATNIIVRSLKPAESQEATGGQSRSWSTRYGVTFEDYEAIQFNFPDADAIVPVKAVGGQVLRNERRNVSQAFGVTPKLLDVARLRVDRGRYLTQADLDEQSMVAVIGVEVARALFPFDDPLGETFRIDDKVVRVVGVLAPVGLAGGAGAALIGRDLNLDVHIPITSARSVFGDLVIRRQSGQFSAEEVEISEIFVTSPSRDRVISDASRLRRLMEHRHARQQDVELIVPYELLEEARRTAMTWTLVLGFIAGISLLVGGIGIMNIMLASVTERTREIGIRRALGATRKHVIWQFLVETGVLSTIGGLIGILLGVSASIGIGLAVASVSTSITMWSIILSFCVAAATGLIFGLYPATVAASQDPIVALRHD
ncbi:MAG: FtsX-like permease family protein [Phycisphaeraceae bacterium]|nr:MAG: FtsX-like permease family protein [Phycisphaeraceae bacterium]